jgi:hypothetical protein
MSDENERSVASAGSTANDGQVSRRAILGTPKPILIALKIDAPLTTEALRRIDNHMRPIVERSGVPFVLVPYGMTLEAVVDPRERGE